MRKKQPCIFHAEVPKCRYISTTPTGEAAFLLIGRIGQRLKSAVDQLKQFAHLEESDGKDGPMIPLERKHTSLPRRCKQYKQAESRRLRVTQTLSPYVNRTIWTALKMQCVQKKVVLGRPNAGNGSRRHVDSFGSLYRAFSIGVM
ncbi:hypothetical protein Vadar_004952 [Vaccinium darrowii]|uniref:Uncharacterized protein n=1 Tax=Vaccinium darrowii TaxID=229202 RepID=A0ACB7XGJ1_9ERIC|nr:hypothetical protein Vadar_004952 [Vaccinium darrowii]